MCPDLKGMTICGWLTAAVGAVLLLHSVQEVWGWIFVGIGSFSVIGAHLLNRYFDEGKQ